MKTATNSQTNDRAIRCPEVMKMTGLSRSTIWRLETHEGGDFPKRFRIGARGVAWSHNAMQEWLATRPTVKLEKEVNN